MKTFLTALIIVKLFLVVLVQKCVTQESSSTGQSSSTIPSTTSTPVLHLDGNNITWNPSPMQEVQIECDLGYKISATIVDCNINGTLSIGGPNEALMFTYNVINKPSFFFNTNKLNAAFNGEGSITVIFSRVGELVITTTTEISTTTINLPTASINDTDELAVHLTGKIPTEYRNIEVLDSLRDMIKQMAQEYCETEGFEIADNITISNVDIREIVICPTGYPTCPLCVEVRFAVPINLKEDSLSPWTGYQLTSEHLRIMWDRLSSKYISDGISQCYHDNINGWVKWQIVLIAVCTFGFLVFLLIFRYSVEKMIKRAQRQNRQLADQNLYQTEDRLSKISLPPHYLQETPPLFESTYPMYNPPVGSTNLGFEPDNNVDIDSDSDDSSIVEESGA